MVKKKKTLEERIDVLTDMVKVIKDGFDYMVKNMLTIDVFNDFVDRVDMRFNNVEERLDRIEVTLNGHGNRLDGLEDKVRVINNKIGI